MRLLFFLLLTQTLLTTAQLPKFLLTASITDYRLTSFSYTYLLSFLRIWQRLLYLLDLKNRLLHRVHWLYFKRCFDVQLRIFSRIFISVHWRTFHCSDVLPFPCIIRFAGQGHCRLAVPKCQNQNIYQQTSVSISG